MKYYTKEEAQLCLLLRALAVAAALLSIITLVGAYFGPATTFFVEAPWVSNTVAGTGLIALLAWFAAADVRRFRTLIHLLIGSLLFGAVLFAIFAFGPHAAGYVGATLAAATGSGAVGLVLLVALRRTPATPGVLPWMTDKPPLLIERIGQVVYVIFGLFSIVVVVGTILLTFTGPLTAFLGQPVFIGGSTVKIALLAALALLGASQIRRNSDMIMLLILGHVVSLVGIVVTLAGIAHFGEKIVDMYGIMLSTRQIMLSGLLLDGIITLSFTGLQIAMAHCRLDYLGFLSPVMFRTIEALAEALFGVDAEKKTPPYKVALRLDRYLSSFPSSRLVITQLAVIGLEYSPLLHLLPPYSIISREFRRDFIDNLFKQDISDKHSSHPILDLLQAAMRIGMQGVYIGYYSSENVQQDIGYAPFSQRYADYKNIKIVRKYPPLGVTTPNDVRRLGIDVIANPDVVIIGSGAGGAILAEQLANQGREVLMLERGLYVPPDEFNEDEITMVGRLYSDGALQVSQNYRFQIIQGNCVGGSTVVNNAVCFDTPDRVLQRWNDPNGSNAGIDVAEFRLAQAAIKQRLMIKSIKDSTTTRDWKEVLNPGDRVIGAGVNALGLKPGDQYDVVRANIVDCLGCGYCNIGCKFGRKLSMLDEVLPKAQRDHGPDRFRILSEANVVKLEGSDGKVREIVVQLRDGRRLLVQNPKTVVVSAGTVASSWLLMRSGIGNGELPVGQHLCFNMGSPLHGYWPSNNGCHLNSFAGLQIAHYLELADHPGFVYETWFNPPVTQAMAMPGWLDQHYTNMQRYTDLSAVGTLVGTETNAYITPALLLRGEPDVVYSPTEHDMQTLVEALIYLGRIMFAGGAQEVLASTRSYKEESIFRKPEELERLHKIVRSDRDIILGTGHPQGGNAMSKTRGQDRGVIGPDFKVYGYDNLYVCDASVFPSPTTVNPQLTVMTMAHYAASRVR